MRIVMLIRKNSTTSVVGVFRLASRWFEPSARLGMEHDFVGLDVAAFEQAQRLFGTVR